MIVMHTSIFRHNNELIFIEDWNLCLKYTKIYDSLHISRGSFTSVCAILALSALLFRLLNVFFFAAAAVAVVVVVVSSGSGEFVFISLFK